MFFFSSAAISCVNRVCHLRADPPEHADSSTGGPPEPGAAAADTIAPLRALRQPGSREREQIKKTQVLDGGGVKQTAYSWGGEMQFGQVAVPEWGSGLVEPDCFSRRGSVRSARRRPRRGAQIDGFG